MRHTTPFLPATFVAEMSEWGISDTKGYPGYIRTEDSESDYLVGGYFEHRVADRILKDITGSGDFEGGYDAIADKYWVNWAEDEPEDKYWYGADLITIDGKLVRVYAIGANLWTWHRGE